MAELTYTRVGDYYIPYLLLDPEPEAEKFYGKYGDLRREYIREHRPTLGASLVNSIQASAKEMVLTELVYA